MQTNRLHLNFRRYWVNDRINYSIRVLIALVGVVLPCWYYNSNNEVTPLVLGVIAAALAETDDNLMGHIKALTLTLLCFLIASVSIEVLFPYPILFALGLFASTFGFIMLGSMGPRYASIAFASLLLAVYTMLGADHSVNLWYQPMLLLGGAFWYGCLSLTWHILWPNQPVQRSLANVFSEFADYLDHKSQLFEPVADLVPQPLRLKAASQNTGGKCLKYRESNPIASCSPWAAQYHRRSLLDHLLYGARYTRTCQLFALSLSRSGSQL